jgi:3'-phosphoadenosine 5'-phosphosulfate (PAPS) 3'-phosphatase
MDNKKTSGFAKLALKAGAIFGTAFAALTGNSTEVAQPQQFSGNTNTIEVSTAAKQKPMTVLKLNTTNPELSKLIAQHSSHSSHSSHNSHSSHYSHSSGGMFA